MSDQIKRLKRKHASDALGYINEINRLDSSVAHLERELAAFQTAGIVEIAVRNVNVAHYMNHWEGRAEKAERERDEAQARAALVPMLNQRIQTIADERDEARGCLRDTIESLTVRACGGVYAASHETVQRWRKAAGLEEGNT